MHLRRWIAVASLATATIACQAVAASAGTLASYEFPPVAGAWSLAPGEYYADITGASFETWSGFDAAGHRVALAGAIQERSFRTYVDLGWKKTVSLQLGLPFTTTTHRPSGGVGTSQTGLGDLSVGLRWSLTNGPGATALQLRWETPSGYDHTLSPSLGDGLQKLSATLQFGAPLGRQAFWQLGGGYRFQYKTLTDISETVTKQPTNWKWPDHVTWNGALAAWLGRVQAAGLFASDVASFLPGNEARPMASTAIGTRLTYRTDGRLDAFAGSWHTTSGKNSLDVDEYYAGIAWKATKLDRLRGFAGGDARP